MTGSVALLASLWLGQLLGGCAYADSIIPSKTTTASVQFTVPASVNSGVDMIPNIQDPNAKNAQEVCPGYKVSQVKSTNTGFTAKLILAGRACNVYGTDVDSLNLTVDYQAEDRLNINIIPSYLDSKNQSWFLIPETVVPKAFGGEEPISETDLVLTWSNEPSFNFKVIRKLSGEILFNTEGTILVFENQFIEFVSALPPNYNLYGLGERIHGLRLGNNFVATTYAADVGDPIDSYVTALRNAHSG
jgi:alpha-glucosidase